MEAEDSGGQSLIWAVAPLNGWMELFHALLVKITLSMYVFSFCNDVPPVLMKYIRQNTSKLLTYFVKPKFSRHIKYAPETMTQKAQLTKSGN